MGGEANDINCIKEYKHSIVITGTQEQRNIILEICHVLEKSDIEAVYINGDLEMVNKYCLGHKCNLLLVAL